MARFFRRRKFCRFTAEGVKEIDYKDLDTLKSYITETGSCGCHLLAFMPADTGRKLLKP